MEPETINQLESLESLQLSSKDAVNTLEAVQELVSLREKHGFFLGETVWFWMLHNDINSFRLYEAKVIGIHESGSIGIRYRVHDGNSLKETQINKVFLFTTEDQCRAALLNRAQVRRLTNNEE